MSQNMVIFKADENKYDAAASIIVDDFVNFKKCHFNTTILLSSFLTHLR